MQIKPLTTIIAATSSFLIAMLLPDIIWAKQQATTTGSTAITTNTNNQIANNKDNQFEVIKISSVLAKNINTTHKINHMQYCDQLEEWSYLNLTVVLPYH